jgi:hypothetical protein
MGGAGVQGLVVLVEFAHTADGGCSLGDHPATQQRTGLVGLAKGKR